MQNEVKLIENSPLRDLALSEGLQFGLGVFETMRRLPTGIEDFKRHIERLKNSALALGISIPSEFEDLERLKTHIETTLAPMSEREPLIKVVKLTLFKQGNESRWMVTERPFPYKKAHFEEGFRLKVSAIRRNSSSLFQRHKTLNYGENWLEKQKAVENGYQEVLFLNENQLLTETAASNLFFYSEGKWHTPEVSCGILNGIMRQRVIDYFCQRGTAVEEGRYTLEDLLASEQVFLTNALMGLMPVKSIEAHEFSLKTHQEIINDHVIDPARSWFE